MKVVSSGDGSEWKSFCLSFYMVLCDRKMGKKRVTEKKVRREGWKQRAFIRVFCFVPPLCEGFERDLIEERERVRETREGR